MFGLPCSCRGVGLRLLTRRLRNRHSRDWDSLLRARRLCGVCSCRAVDAVDLRVLKPWCVSQYGVRSTMFKLIGKYFAVPRAGCSRVGPGWSRVSVFVLLNPPLFLTNLDLKLVCLHFAYASTWLTWLLGSLAQGASTLFHTHYQYGVRSTEYRLET